MADVADITHLLRRTEFVARPDRVAELVGGSFAEAVDDVLGGVEAPVPIPSEINHQADTGAYQQFRFATHWWLERMTRAAATPMRERMAFFWHGHFCSDWRKVNHTGAMTAQNALFRDLGLGNLVDLARAVATQPALLEYLDNTSNRWQSPNQNFSRELLELFLLGVGNYTEADVEAATRAWTGYSADAGTGQFLFRDNWHDGGTKTFLGRTGSWNGDDVISIVFGDPGTVGGTVAVGPHAGLPSRVVAARFLSRKLWESFAHPGPPAGVVDHLADVLLENEFEIRPWVRALLLHPDFLAPAARRGLVRTPTEFIVALLHATGLSASAVNPEWFAERMGQQLYRPPNVSGWRSNGYWVNASAMAARAEFAQHVRWVASTQDEMLLASGSRTWADLDDMSPALLIDTLAADLGVGLAASTRSSLVDWAQAEQHPWGPDWWRSRNALLLLFLVPEMNVA